MCGIFTAIPAVIVAKGALEITDQNPNHPDAGTAKAALILGWINIGLFAVGIFFWIAFLMLAVSFGG
jgi:magnesium-transporting ATPase (P-type)